MSNAFVMVAELQYGGMQVGYELKFQGYRPAADAWPKADVVFKVFDWVFGIVFTLELLLKMTVMRCEFFKHSWGWLDFVVVTCFILEQSFGNIVPVGTQWLRIARLLRLGRLLKIVRTFDGFDHLFLITTALKASLVILAWALALLFVLHMTMSLVLSQFLHATYFKDSSHDSAAQHKMYEYFGTWTRAMVSMFELTLANWPPICRLLAEEVSEWFALYVLLHKFTVGFAVVGVINGVFMQETFKVASTDDIIMVRQRVKAMNLHSKNMRQLFEALDSDSNGKVTDVEFAQLVRYPEVRTWLASMDLHTDDFATLFRLIDEDKDGFITFDEMLGGIGRLKGPARSLDLITFHREHQESLRSRAPSSSHMSETAV